MSQSSHDKALKENIQDSVTGNQPDNSSSPADKDEEQQLHGNTAVLDDDIPYTPERLAEEALRRSGDGTIGAAGDKHGSESGRLVLDPEEAKAEFGEEIASKLKLSSDGKFILWPQPTNSSDDPQNWSEFKKNYQLMITAAAAFVPDFSSGLGIASLFNLAEEYNTSTSKINNLTSNWSIFLLGPGGVIAVFFVRKYGRLPVLFWSQFLALCFLIGCSVAPTLAIFAGMRCLAAFFGTAPQICGLYTVTDLFPFHKQARKTTFWTAAFIISPFVSPFFGGFIAAHASWRWVYGGLGCIYNGLVVITIALFGEETMYDRYLHPVPPRPTTGLRYRIETLLGITGIKMAKYRTTLRKAMYDMFDVAWRPQLLLVCIYVGSMFGWGIGINVTNPVFLGEPKAEGGFGFSQDAIAGAYATPIIAVTIGEILGHRINDFIAFRLTKKNHGVFKAEYRLWSFYISLSVFVIGFCIFGGTIQGHWNVAGVFFGWGLAYVGILINTVTGYNILNDCFPSRRGEISALLNLARTLFGFAVPYFQEPWVERHGALQTFGCEAAISAGLFILIVPFLQFKGQSIRAKFSIKS